MFSSEHAPIALGASGNRVVIAESFARIFFRNCIATGELYPYETAERLVDAFSTGDEVCVFIYIMNPARAVKCAAVDEMLWA